MLGLHKGREEAPHRKQEESMGVELLLYVLLQSLNQLSVL